MDSLNQALYTLLALDKLLNQKIELVIIGRSALALGYKNMKPKFSSTMDVDSVVGKKYL